MNWERTGVAPVKGPAKVSKVIHVHPVDDLRPHVIENYPDMVCWCRPECDDDGVIVHNSMDRREEYDEDVPNHRLPS